MIIFLTSFIRSGIQKMAQKLVTQEIVNQVANQLLSEGTEPSSNNIQKRIGGGSFTTVKRYLDIWRQQKTMPEIIASDLPPDIEAKGFEWLQSIWQIALAQAQKEFNASRNEASAEINAAKIELSEAMNEIARLELNEIEQSNAIEQLQNEHHHMELALTEANANNKHQEGLIQELKKILQETRTLYDKMVSETATIKGELSEAVSDLTRLQTNQAEQTSLIEQQKERIHDAEQSLVEANTRAQRTTELEIRLAAVQSELTETRKVATDKAVEAGKLTGEAETLRTQVRELMNALTSPVVEKGSKK